MQISILLFGIARDIVGQSELKLDIERGSKVAEIKERILYDFPKFELLKHLAVAVNNEYAGNDTVVNEGDEIALIPPVSGG